MRCKGLALIALLLMTVVFGVGQTRRANRPAPKPSVSTPTGTPTPPASPPVRRVMVKLKDGRSLDADFLQASADQVEILVAGNRLKIATDEVAAIFFSPEAVAQAPAPVTPTTGTLAIEAGIIYKSGGNQPVGRTEFRLLDSDFESLLSGAGLRALGNIGLVATWGIQSKYDSPQVRQINDSIKQHTIQVVTTDFNGKAEFEDIKPGQYFVFGQVQTRGGFAIWNRAIEIKAGKNSAILDQNNAATAF